MRKRWKDYPVSDAQLEYIREMQEMSWYPLPPFAGKTRGEASDYIDTWRRLAYERIDERADESNYGDRGD